MLTSSKTDFNVFAQNTSSNYRALSKEEKAKLDEMIENNRKRSAAVAIDDVRARYKNLFDTESDIRQIWTRSCGSCAINIDTNCAKRLHL